MGRQIHSHPPTKQQEQKTKLKHNKTRIPTHIILHMIVTRQRKHQLNSEVSLNLEKSVRVLGISIDEMEVGIGCTSRFTSHTLCGFVMHFDFVLLLVTYRGFGCCFLLPCSGKLFNMQCKLWSFGFFKIPCIFSFQANHIHPYC